MKYAVLETNQGAISVSFCIILYHIAMHFINKNKLFNDYLS